MKLLIVALCGLIFGTAVIVASPLTTFSNQHLLGTRECTFGPSYWCYNLTNAKNCHAVPHCIKAVWEKQNVPEDTDSICKICLDMVTQARDQLRSNETQEELREVFEGSCDLIPIDLVKKECRKMVDNFIPELVEALSSEMNPQQVCSVAGLCNNIAIDQQLAELEKTKTNIKIEDFTIQEVNGNKLSCDNCNNVAQIIAMKFHQKSRDEILDDMLEVCGGLSSLSDGCSNIIITYFNEIYEHMSDNLNAENICHMSGVCADKFHQHPEDIVEIRPMSGVGVVQVKEDIPCELCEQLMKHLRDLLVANTTESEFKEVLEGLCKQTKGFSKECLSIVDEYYPVIYNMLVNNLDANGACCMIGVCQKGLTKITSKGPYMPLLPLKTAQHIEVSLKQTKPRKLLGMDEPKLTNVEIQNAQLPIDRLMGAPNSDVLIENGKWCIICEYILHYIQETLADAKTEDEIKKVVSRTCDQLPKSIEGECRNFIDMYGDGVIALLIQEIDPTQVCPSLKICPAKVNDSEVFAPMPIEVIIDHSSDKPTCPLCLLAVSDLQQKTKSDHSKENIKHALESLCLHLPVKLRSECTDFVDTYSSELIEMLVTDFTAQQICVYLKLCVDSKPDNSLDNIRAELENENKFISSSGGDILTNEIPDNTINGQLQTSLTIEYETSIQCDVCQQAVKEIEKRVVNKQSKEQIKNALEHACDKIRKFKNKCKKFIEKNEDKIIDLIMQELAPKEICRDLVLCIVRPNVEESIDLDTDEALVVSVLAPPSHQQFIVPLEHSIGFEINDSPQCVICEFVMAKLEQELADKKTQDEIKNTIKNICTKLPKSISGQCTKFIDQYADLIISLVDTMPPKEICSNMNLCVKAKLDSKREVIECAICQGAVQALDKVLDDPKVDDNIENILEKTCNELPAKYYKKCSDLVKIYGQSMINLIKTFTEPHKVCSEIGMCFADEYSAFVTLDDNEDDVKLITKKQYHLVGDNECTWGPTHWCKNQELANKCGTSNYCAQNHWVNGVPPS